MLRINKFFEKSETMSWFDFDFGFWINFITKLILFSMIIQNSILDKINKYTQNAITFQQD